MTSLERSDTHASLHPRALQTHIRGLVDGLREVLSLSYAHLEIAYPLASKTFSQLPRLGEYSKERISPFSRPDENKVVPSGLTILLLNLRRLLLHLLLGELGPNVFVQGRAIECCEAVIYHKDPCTLKQEFG